MREIIVIMTPPENPLDFHKYNQEKLTIYLDKKISHENQITLEKRSIGSDLPNREIEVFGAKA